MEERLTTKLSNIQREIAEGHWQPGNRKYWDKVNRKPLILGLRLLSDIRGRRVICGDYVSDRFFYEQQAVVGDTHLRRQRLWNGC